MTRRGSSGAGRSGVAGPEEMARRASERAYAPYSGFRVGAVLEDGNGRLHAGCNVECASIGLSLCAERVALGAALASGAKEFRRLWIYTPTRRPTPPCGACRELLRRFADDLPIIALCEGDAVLRAQLSDLLPARTTTRRKRR